MELNMQELRGFNGLLTKQWASCVTPATLNVVAPPSQKQLPSRDGVEEGKTWDRKGMLSMDRMAMLSGPPMFMGMEVVMATGWAIFMDPVEGMLTDAMLSGPVMVTGCWRLRVLLPMFICAAMVTGLLEWHRFIAEEMGPEMVTGVAEEEMQRPWYTSRNALPHISHPWFFLTGLAGFFGILWCGMLPMADDVMMLTPEDTEVVAVERMPATVEM
ncbi:hypothetical protein EYF80_002982 [Liparis tanakae]|uniref:Uncharacterized protein n=1 Tax=Liparis tanakae TaxID=230148 RepID=A0A4Z2J9B1_9TELE|nr:hypothetical protein EYF80_002982 [Liparis tanakae]